MVRSVFSSFLSLLALFAIASPAGAWQNGQSPGQVGQTPAQTQTLKNLYQAFQGEAAASHRYELFAKRSDDENYPQIAKLFRAASKSEAIHRDNHSKAMQALGSKAPQISSEQIAIGSTEQNLKEAIADERKDGQTMYPSFISQAEKAKAPDAVRSFEAARDTELGHVQLFNDALAHMGKMKLMDYYVNLETGVIAETPVGQRLTAANSQQFQKIS